MSCLFAIYFKYFFVSIFCINPKDISFVLYLLKVLPSIVLLLLQSKLHMLGVFTIMYERMKQEEKIKGMKNKEQITIPVSNQKRDREKLFNKIIEEHKNCTTDCVITNCKVDIKSDNITYYKCTKYTDLKKSVER